MRGVYVRFTYYTAGAYLTAKRQPLNTLHRFDSSTHKRIHSNRRRFRWKVSSSFSPRTHLFRLLFFLLCEPTVYGGGPGASENFTSHPFVVPEIGVYELDFSSGFFFLFIIFPSPSPFLRRISDASATFRAST